MADQYRSSRGDIEETSGLLAEGGPLSDPSGRRTFTAEKQGSLSRAVRGLKYRSVDVLGIVAGCIAFALFVLLIVFITLFLLHEEVRSIGIGNLKVNEIQMMGTHNSYHFQSDAELLNLTAEFKPHWPIALAYNHTPIPHQLEKGYRFFEIDVYDDPSGGLYSRRAINDLLGRDVLSKDKALLKPGWKVLHIQDVDFESSCNTFKDCLQQISNFSKSHPRHFPIGIRVEVKYEYYGWPPKSVHPDKVTVNSLLSLEAEIQDIFPDDAIIRPSDVLVEIEGDVPPGSHLKYKVNWPTLSHAAGKVFFFLITNEPARVYTKNVKYPFGRVMFATYKPLGGSDPNMESYVAFDPDVPVYYMATLVKEGAFVFARADADTEEARAGDPTRLHEAIQRGANVILTDFPQFEAPNPFGTKYVGRLPGGVQARCNPITAPKACKGVERYLKEPIP
eukprot:TRINITY_DN745_c0_g1_i1.p1 TRINITY_DN745_c0_g1~~TRINITY_DN745_c0_g1_i1.p1  ORF type:complete len:448 (-),score=44.47 TRINITY_DN745_c0_g1_i1:954-2297(-)